MKLPHDPVILPLGTYPKKPQTLVLKNICTAVFTAALLTVAKIWKQPRCPSVDEWIKKTCGTFTQWNTTQP